MAFLIIQNGVREVDAACYVCDEVVELDNALAACFLRDFSRYLTEVRQSSDQYSSVDLSHCVGTDGSENRGIVKMPVLEPDAQPNPSASAPLRTVYIMDERSLLCLQKLVVPLSGKLSPGKPFDLIKECAP
ncbi:hypothetical protein [Rhizobium sp. 18065]|uniref:hypothetical protein n=1 Tax=Rhizobium sp. 18065 TaxID=2681411 RepID=UPI00135A54BD|nr:hypothetical protein [Rhizobium sp. 18065]